MVTRVCVSGLLPALETGHPLASLHREPLASCPQSSTGPSSHPDNLPESCVLTILGLPTKTSGQGRALPYQNVAAGELAFGGRGGSVQGCPLRDPE